MATFIIQENTNNTVYISYDDNTHILDWGEKTPEIYNWSEQCCQNVGGLVVVSYIKDSSVYERDIWIDKDVPTLKDEVKMFDITIENPTSVKYLDYLGTVVISDSAIQHKDQIMYTNVGKKVIYWNHGYFITEKMIQGFNTKNIKFISALWNNKYLRVFGICNGQCIIIKIDNLQRVITSIEPDVRKTIVVKY